MNVSLAAHKKKVFMSVFSVTLNVAICVYSSCFSLDTDNFFFTLNKTQGKYPPIACLLAYDFFYILRLFNDKHGIGSGGGSSWYWYLSLIYT